MVNTMTETKMKEEAKSELIDLITGNVPSVSHGMAASVRINGKTVFSKSHGEIKDPAFQFTESTVFDMASLTKPVVTTTLMMKMIDKGKIALEDSLSSLGMFPSSENAGQLTVRSLLSHSSGLIWHYPLYSFGRTRDDYLKGIRAFAASAKMYTKEEYSDLNFMTLAFLLEHLTGKTLDVLAKEEIFEPLGMKNSCFNPIFDKNTIAPTEKTEERGLIWGKVHDENSFYLGGVAGHAGLFSNLEDMGKFSDALINGRLFSFRTLELMRSPANEYLGGTFGLGWMIKLPRHKNPSDSFGFSSFIGDYASFGTFGHTGFTGTSLVIDPERRIAVTLLTNRVYPTRDNVGILRFRRLFHNTVFRNMEQ